MLNYLGFASGLLPFIAAVFNRKNLDTTLKTAAFFFLLSFLIDFLMWLVYIKYLTVNGLIIPKNNHPLLYLSIFISTIFYTFFYYNSFYNQRTKNFILICSVVTCLLIVVAAIINGIWKYPDWENTTLGVYLIIASLLFFYQIFNRQEFMEIEKQALFWINSGVLIYFSFTIFLYMLARRMNIQEYLVINSTANIISNLLFAIGLSCKPQKTV
ncbi:MAG: hypothetical protein ACRYFA_12235 [Janthinobacterium lividum]